ncbi:MAG: hypothetical protein J6333_07965 [Planctomycetes bacterium]|nr:hypothetical protein [Planctomycetota bacterium]
MDLLIKSELPANLVCYTRQQVATIPETARPAIRPETRPNPAQSGDDSTAPACPLQAIGQEPGRAGADALAAPDGLTPAGVDACPTAPGMAVEATESARDGLAGVVASLRDELAAQRAENAKLRETIDNLPALLAKMAGAKHD